MVLDLLITINIVMINHVIQKMTQYAHHPLDIKWVLGALVAVDIVLLSGAYFFDLIWVSMMILMVELCIAVIGALLVWGIVFSVETWFEYIC